MTDPEPAPAPTAEPARGAEHWARAVSRLSVSNMPKGAVDHNVTGRRLAGPVQGFGKMWQKTYRTALPRDRVSAAELIATWRRDFSDFWPAGAHFYAPLTGLAPGEVAILSMSLPGRVNLSTGVMVLYADEESFTLMTPQGHMFAGWITFSATERGEETVAQAQVLMRASDPVFELALVCGGHRQEDRFWERTLTAVAARFGHAAVVDTQVVCVDTRRQWSRWGNVRHSSVIGSARYMVTAPLRAATRSRTRPPVPAAPTAPGHAPPPTDG